MTDSPLDKKMVFPKSIIIATIVISVLPFILNLAGIDFGSHGAEFDNSKIEHLSQVELADAMFNPKESTADKQTKLYLTDAAFGKLSGALLHTILEWSAFCVALFTVLLAFTHYRIKMDVITPIIGMAMFMAGSMDAFHTLAADRLIPATADNTNLIPFTWAICRTFNALIMVVGVSIIFFKGFTRGAGVGFVAGVSVVFGVCAYAVIHYCATQTVLPQTMFPGSMVTRPWDAIALVIFVVSALTVYPAFHKRQQSYFSAALWLSVLPEIATQMHMAFGSVALFDNHFNIAHFLKIMAYLVPCAGLILDYMHIHRQEQVLVQTLSTEISVRNETESELALTVKGLEKSNDDLDQFAYIASHDLKAPLRSIANLSEWIKEDLQDAGNEVPGDVTKNLAMLRGRVKRLEGYIDDLLNFSRAGREQYDSEEIDVTQLINDITGVMDLPEGFTIDVEGDLPVVITGKAPLEQVFMNLLGNALKHHDNSTEGKVTISVRDSGEFYEFIVSDNGPGIPPTLHKKAFQIFQTLKPRDEVEGSGMGLALVQKQVEGMGGTIALESDGRGARFRFTLPKKTG